MSLIRNSRISHDYDILEKFEGGISLLGFEAKSLRAGKGTLAGSYIITRGGEAYISGLDIPPYQEKNSPADYDSHRLRKLLLHKKEIGQIQDAEGSAGLTAVPLSVYNVRGRIKIGIGIVRGRRSHDKRSAIKKRESEREVRRTHKVR